MTTATLEATTNTEELETDFEFDFNMDDFFAEPQAEQSDQESEAEPISSAPSEAQPLQSDEQEAGNLTPPDVTLVIHPDAEQDPTDRIPEKSIYQKIWDVEHQLAEICREEERLKAHLKSVKESRIETVERLESLLDERDNPEPIQTQVQAEQLKDLLPGMKIESSDGSITITATASSSPQAWGLDQIEILSKYGMTEKKLEALRAAADGGRFDGTIRGLRDWINKYDLWYRDVKGCGASGADKISDALVKYVAANPMMEEPLTAEDEAKHVAAAEFLGHTTSPVRQEEREAAVSPDSTAIIGGSSEYLVPAISPEESPTDTEPTKPARKKRSKKPAEAAGSSDETEDNPEQPTAKPSAGAGDEEEAYLKGCEAGAAGASCSENPYSDRSSPQAKEWQRGWEECSE